MVLPVWQFLFNKTYLRLTILSILIFLLGFNACRPGIRQDKGTPLARVGDHYLYENDIKGLLPPNTSPLDSIVWVRNYTNNWVKIQLLIKKAKQNLKPEQLDFDKQLEKYRNSLISYTYETELIRQQLDTVVTDTQIEEFYNQHKNEFILVKNIVRAMYVVIENNKELSKHFTKLFALPDSLIIDSLEYNCKQYSHDYFLDTTTWLLFDDVLKTIPVKTYNKELFLKNNRFVEVKDKDYIYLINFVDFKIKNDFSPLELERENIKNIIINSRKIKFIKQLHDKLYQDAAQKNEFEIYTYDE